MSDPGSQRPLSRWDYSDRSSVNSFVKASRGYFAIFVFPPVAAYLMWNANQSAGSAVALAAEPLWSVARILMPRADSNVDAFLATRGATQAGAAKLFFALMLPAVIVHLALVIRNFFIAMSDEEITLSPWWTLVLYILAAILAFVWRPVVPTFSGIAANYIDQYGLFFFREAAFVAIGAWGLDLIILNTAAVLFARRVR